MPKIPTYDRQVEPQSLPNTRVANVVDANAYGVGAMTQVARTAEAVGNQTTKGLGQLGAVIAERAQKLQAEQDYSDVLNATQGWMREANTYLYDPEKGVLNKKGYDARGIGEKSLTDLETLGRKYGDKLKNARQQQMFQKYLGDHMNSTASELYRHEAREHRVALEKDTSANINLLVDSAIRSGDPSKVQGIFGQIEGLIRTTWGGSGENTIKEQQQKYKTLYHSEKVKMIFQSDAGLAKDYLESNKNDMDPIMYNKLSEVVGEKVKDNANYNLVQSVIAGARRDANGIIDPVDARARLQAQFQKGGGVSYESFKTALFGQESGGNYNARNERTGAYGKYQILPENWPSWAKAAGLSPDAPQTPENQEKVVEAKLRPLYQKYGAEGAAVAWYAGEQNAKRWAEGKPTAIGDNGNEYSWDAKQGNGDEPSVREYVRSIVVSAGGKGDFDAKEYEAAERRLEAALRDNGREVNFKKSEAINSLQESLRGVYSVQDRISIINAAPGLSDLEKDAQINLEIKSIKTDTATLVRLEYHEAKGSLSAEMITSLLQNGLISADDHRAYSKSLGKQLAGAEKTIKEKEDSDVKVQIHDRVDEILKGKTTDERARVKNMIMAAVKDLPSGVRLEKAEEMIKKQKDSGGKFVVAYSENQTEISKYVSELGQSVGDPVYAKRIIDAAMRNRIFNSGGGTPVAVGEMKNFISEINFENQFVRQAVDLIVRRGEVLNAENLDYAIAAVRGLGGGYGYAGSYKKDFDWTKVGAK